MAISDIIYGGTPYSVALGKLAPYGILRAMVSLASYHPPQLSYWFRCKLLPPLVVEPCRSMTHIWCRNILVYVGFFVSKQSPSGYLTCINRKRRSMLSCQSLLKKTIRFAIGQEFHKKMIRTDLVPQQELQRYKK